MPISPSNKALPGRPCTTATPCASAAAHCAGVMAGSTLASALPLATLRSCKPGCGDSGLATPQSTTVSAKPCRRASTLTAAPPARKFCTICAVTALG